MRLCRLGLVLSLLAASLRGQTLIAHGCYALGVNGGTTSALDTTGANFIAVALEWDKDTAGPATVTDGAKGNTYTGLTAYGFYPYSQIHYTAVTPTVGSGHTWTVSLTASLASVCVQAWSGMVQPAPFDTGKENGSSAFYSGSSITIGSITPTAGPKLIIAAFGLQTSGATPYTINSSFINAEGVSAVPATTCGAGIASLYQATGAAVNPTWTESDSAYALAASQAAFKVASKVRKLSINVQ